MTRKKNQSGCSNVSAAALIIYSTLNILHLIYNIIGININMCDYYP